MKQTTLPTKEEKKYITEYFTNDRKDLLCVLWVSLNNNFSRETG